MKNCGVTVLSTSFFTFILPAISQPQLNTNRERKRKATAIIESFHVKREKIALSKIKLSY